MNKKFIKIILIFFLSIICIPKASALSVDEYRNETTNYRVIIEDDANLLTLTELNQLKEDMIPLTEFGNIAFKTISDNYSSTSYYASNYYHEKFGTTSGTLFLIDMDNRMIYIFSDGENYNVVTTAKANIITDNIYKYATNGDYYECARTAFEQIYTILNGGKIAEPMRYISNVLIALTLAFFINFIIILINTNVKKAKDKEVLANCSITFNIGEIRAAKTGTHSEYSPRSSSSGGSSSGGGGGGGSSGGGGGHSF